MNLVTVSTAIPNLSFPMVQITHPTGDYLVAQHVASNTDWDQTARHIVSQSGTGVAYAGLVRNLRDEYIVRPLGSANDVADFMGRDSNMPERWDGSTVVRGGKVCFQWRENISFEQSNGPKQPANTDWYMSQAWARTLGGGIYFLSDGQWEFAASGAGRNLKYATETGRLGGPDGKVLAYCSMREEQTRTIDVDDSRNSRTPDGIIGMTGNVGEWTDRNPDQEYQFGLRGGSCIDRGPGGLRVDFRVSRDPGRRHGSIGVRFGAAVPRT